MKVQRLPDFVRLFWFTQKLLKRRNGTSIQRGIRTGIPQGLQDRLFSAFAHGPERQIHHAFLQDFLNLKASPVFSQSGSKSDSNFSAAVSDVGTQPGHANGSPTQDTLQLAGGQRQVCRYDQDDAALIGFRKVLRQAGLPEVSRSSSIRREEEPIPPFIP